MEMWTNQIVYLRLMKWIIQSKMRLYRISSYIYIWVTRTRFKNKNNSKNDSKFIILHKWKGATFLLRISILEIKCWNGKFVLFMGFLLMNWITDTFLFTCQHSITISIKNGKNKCKEWLNNYLIKNVYWKLAISNENEEDGKK